MTGWKLVEDNDDKGLYGNDAMSLIRALDQEKDVALFGLNLRPALKAAAFEVCDGNVCVPSWIWHPNLPLGDRVDIYDLESVITYGCSTTIDISLALAQLGMGPLPLAHDTPDMQIGYVRQLMGILF